MRRSPLILLSVRPLLLLAAAVGVACLSCASFAQENSTSYPVRGTVLDAISGQPLGRALISLNQDFAVLTNADGQFSFDNVPAGDFMVSIRKPGYEGIGQVGNIAFRGGIIHQPRPPQHIRVGPDTPSLTFRIAPLGVITGHVTLSTADAADGIQVTAYTRRMQNGRLSWTMAGMARTRSDGSFRIADLSPGNYLIYTQPSLDQDRPATNGTGPVFGYPAVYYPGVTDPSAAGLIVLRAGQQAQADISLVRQQFFDVTAIVRADTDQPANFQILDSSGRQTMLAADYNRRTQTVHASVPSGSWSLEAHSFGHDVLFGRTDFQVSGAPVSLAIALLPIPHIPVDIRRDFTVSADGSQPQTSGPGINLFLVSADEFTTGYGGGLNTVEGGNGDAWEIRVMQPGRYWVQAMPFGAEYISSITSGGVDLAANPLTVIPGSTPAPIDVTLRNDGGSINGQIDSQASSLNGLAASAQQPQVWIYAIPLFPSPGIVPTGFAAPNGQFTIPNLAPGSYRVVACDSQQQIDFRSPESLAAWAGKGQTVTVDPGSSAHVDLTVISTEGAE